MSGDAYRVVLSNNSFYKEVEVSSSVEDFSVGTIFECNYRLRKEHFFEDFVISFDRKEEGWTLVCTDNLYFSDGGVRKLLRTDMMYGETVSVKYRNFDVELFKIELNIDFLHSFISYERMIDTSECKSIKIGDDSSAQIRVSGPYVNGDVIELDRSGKDFSYKVKKATYGFLINGFNAKDTGVIKNGDFFSLSNFNFFYRDNMIYTEVRNDLKIAGVKCTNAIVPPNYPKFQRNTRIKRTVDDSEIEVLDPPAKPKKNKDRILTSLMPSFGMLMSSGFMAMAGGSGMLLFSAITGGMAVATTVVNVVQNNSDFKKEVQERSDKYSAYAKEKEAEIKEARENERIQLEEIYIDTAQEKERLESFSSELFDRCIYDEDFLNVRLGTGQVKSLRPVKFKKHESLEIEDDLQLIPEKLAEDFRSINNVPVVCDFSKANSVGIIGLEELRYQLMKNIVYDIASRHFYADVRMFFIAEESHAERIRWLRFLPHVSRGGMGSRNIAVNDHSKNVLYDYLFKELTARSQIEKNEDEVIPRERLILFFYDEFGVQNHPISKFIDKASELDVTFVFMNDFKGDIPFGCSSLIFLDSSSSGKIVNTSDGSALKFQYAPVSDEDAYKLVDLLSPVYAEEISLESALTKNITLFEMLGIMEAADLDIGERWKRSNVIKSLGVPIGVTKSGDVILDLHDKAHGPHGLVAGTTGSGKSELLQTYILSMASFFHPYEIAFLIIDFKGGGMVNQFKGLPHLLGAITNIDGKQIERSLKSIRAELRKRERLFAESGVNHIDKYIQLFKTHRVATPLPHLIVIVDEFAELKEEQPEFMKELISAARIGRSLGVHLILATQKPSGQVDEQIWSNSRFKLCLKVQSQEDSNEVLHSPQAAEIKEPGRAYLQVGNNEVFELFQSAYSGAPEKITFSNEKEFVIYQIDKNEKLLPIYSQKRKKDVGSSMSQLESVVEYIGRHCGENGIRKLDDICIPPLTESIAYPEAKTLKEQMFDIGICDDPENQLQCSTWVDFNNKNTFIVGSSQFGKTNLLQSLIRSISVSYSPDQANIYILDFASMSLKNFEELPHVGGVVLSTEDEKLKNFFKMIYAEIADRKVKLLSAGVSSYFSYVEAGNKDIPRIYILVDNLNALMELYFQEDDSLLNIIREGIAFGITVTVTCTQTAGISFKYLSNFANKIGLYCNDNNEYLNIFEHAGLSPDEVPGRCVLEIDKRMIECQMYLAFDGVTEKERSEKIKAYIAGMRKMHPDRNAKYIPTIPGVLGVDQLLSRCGETAGRYMLPIGLAYEDVSPFILDISQLGVLGLCGKENTGHRNFLGYLLDYLEKQSSKAASKVVLIDDFSRKLECFKSLNIVSKYTLDIADALSVVAEWSAVLENRYNTLMETGTLSEKDELLIMIIQNNDAAKKINDDWDTMEKFREFVNRYKGMNVVVIFSNYQNVSVSYDSPEPLRMVKDSQHLIFFEDLANLKVFDIAYEELRANKKKLEKGDAYYILDGGITKLKIVKSDAEV